MHPTHRFPHHHVLGHRGEYLRTLSRREVSVEVAFVRHPYLVPQTRVVTSQCRITLHAALLRRRQVDVAPDGQIEGVECLGVKEPDEVHDHNLAERNRLELAKRANAPIEPAERPGSVSTKRGHHLPNEARTLDPIPVPRAAMRTNGIEEVVATHAHAAGNGRDEFARERGLSGTTVPRDADDDRVTPLGASVRNHDAQILSPRAPDLEAGDDLRCCPIQPCDRNMRRCADLSLHGSAGRPKSQMRAEAVLPTGRLVSCEPPKTTKVIREISMHIIDMRRLRQQNRDVPLPAEERTPTEAECQRPIDDIRVTESLDDLLARHIDEEVRGERDMRRPFASLEPFADIHRLEESHDAVSLKLRNHRHLKSFARTQASAQISTEGSSLHPGCALEAWRAECIQCQIRRKRKP